MAFHNEKTKEEIHKLASEYVSRESNRDALITVTHTILSNDAKYATILFTTLPEAKEEAVLDFLKRKRAEFKQHVMKHSKIGRVPFFNFEIDKGQKSANAIYTIE